MDDITLIMFMIVFALCVIFSSFSITLQKAEWAFLSMICWFAFGTLFIGLATDDMFYTFTFLFWAIGLIFMLFGFKYLFDSFSANKREGKMEIRESED